MDQCTRNAFAEERSTVNKAQVCDLFLFLPKVNIALDERIRGPG
jgi:hypothetical protein